MEGEKTFAGHNYKADYKFTFSHGLKANGEDQVKEIKIRSDEIEGLIETSFTILKDWISHCKRNGVKVVSPYEKGREPDE